MHMRERERERNIYLIANTPSTQPYSITHYAIFWLKESSIFVDDVIFGLSCKFRFKLHTRQRVLFHIFFASILFLLLFFLFLVRLRLMRVCPHRGIYSR